MSYLKHTDSSVVVVRWLETTVPDLKEVESLIRKWHVTSGKKVDYIAIIPADAKPPPAEVRQEMVKVIRGVAQMCRSVGLVMESEGLRGAMVRGVVTGIMMATSGVNLKVYASVEEAIRALPGDVDKERLRNAATSLRVEATT